VPHPIVAVCATLGWGLGLPRKPLTAIALVAGARRLFERTTKMLTDLRRLPNAHAIAGTGISQNMTPQLDLLIKDIH